MPAAVRPSRPWLTLAYASGSVLLALFLGLVQVGTAPAGEAKSLAEIPLPAVFAKEVPETIQDLRAIQDYVRQLLPKLLPCTVGLQIGPSQGSGVIITQDGMVLTAGHVTKFPGQKVIVFLSDGRKVQGKTLGINHALDSGMVQILDKGPWPHLDMGKSANLRTGQWSLAIGHPGGYKAGRSPVVRLGRVLGHGSKIVRTDCTLVGGDSGGPLLDMHGKVIGIHSKIGEALSFNLHVPVDTYRETWDRLARSEAWGNKKPAQAYLGLQIDTGTRGVRVREVTEGSPADKAGLKADDVLLAFDGKKINDADELIELIQNKEPGNEVALEVRRNGEILTLRVVLGKKPT